MKLNPNRVGKMHRNGTGMVLVFLLSGTPEIEDVVALGKRIGMPESRCREIISEIDSAVAGT